MIFRSYVCFWGGLILLFVFQADCSFVKRPSEEELANVSLRLYMGKTVDDDDNFREKFIGEAAKLLQFMDLEKSTVVYVHGYHESLNHESVRTVVGAYLKRQDYNVIAVNWRKIAAKFYTSSFTGVSDVGKVVAKALNEMVSSSLNSRTLYVVGHSLGAQVSGYIGRNVDFKLPRITGLDPAGPGFYIIKHPLASGDAEFVDIIHTDAGIYGFAKQTGDVDFYPNGGQRIQPGCPYLFVPLDSNDFCSHYRSWHFYSESVINEKAFTGVQCDSLYKFKTKKCRYNKKVLMGLATPIGTKGSFYLETNDKSPYGRGEDGIIPK